MTVIELENPEPSRRRGSSKRMANEYVLLMLSDTLRTIKYSSKLMKSSLMLGWENWDPTEG